MVKQERMSKTETIIFGTLIILVVLYGLFVLTDLYKEQKLSYQEKVCENISVPIEEGNYKITVSYNCSVTWEKTETSGGTGQIK